MKKLLITLTAILFISLTGQGQNLFFIGENSFPCTETYTLQSNSEEYYANDLNVVIAKDGKEALIGVSTKTKDLMISGKLMIYLDDGTVIALDDDGFHDYVDKIASAAYYVTDEDLNKMKNSNINTVRYRLEYEDGHDSFLSGKYSASNKGEKYDFPKVIANFIVN
jgi:hypothetical protein